MFRHARKNPVAPVLAALAALWAGTAQGQVPAPSDPVPASPGEALGAYLGDRRLWRVAAAHLRDRLRHGTPSEKAAAAEALGDIYVHQIAEATTPQERQRIDGQARDLLSMVPESDSFALRIELAVAAFKEGEQLAERYRRRSDVEGQREEAERILRTVIPQFDDLVGKLNRQTSLVERREAQGREEDAAEVRRDLERSRNLRSLANYFAGWANYYHAYVSGNPGGATRAMEQFGVLLNAAPNRPATLEKMKESRFELPHVARAAIGCALASSLLGNHSEARRWIDAVDLSDTLDPGVREQLFAHRLSVLAEGSGWAEIDVAVRRHRARDGNTTGLLTSAEARLAAVLALDANNDPATPPRSRTFAGGIAQVAMGDLVTLGEAGNVLDLVERYGTSGLVGQGFISSFVRGLHAYEGAKDARLAAGEAENQPSARPEIANRFREAATLLKGAIETSDSAQFAADVLTARITRGLALFYAGDLDAASVELQQAAGSEGAAPQRKRALGSAIFVLDYAVKGGKVSAKDERDRMAALFVQSFPDDERSVRLLLDSLKIDGVTAEKSVEVLLAVDRYSPLYGPARREAARLLYTRFRAGRDAEGRAFAAMKFVPVGEESLRFDQEAAIAAPAEGGKEAAERAILQARRLAEVFLTTSTPDPDRAEAALTALTNVAALYAVDLGSIEPELLLRRLQIAVLRQSFAEADRLVDQSHGLGGPRAREADVWMYKHAVDESARDPGDIRARAGVIRFGRALLVHFTVTDPQASVVRESVAEASARAWRETADVSMRDEAIRLDTLQLTVARTAAALRRLAELVEAAGRPDEALARWNELLAGLPQGSDAWHEARYHSLRLLSVGDAPGAIVAFEQYRALYPDLGPLEGRARFKDLERTLGASGPPGAPAPPPPTKGPT